MEKEELSKIIGLLTSLNIQEHGCFSMHYYDHDNSEFFIKANKEGLALFTAQLLKTLRDFDESIKEDNKYYFHVEDTEVWWKDGDLYLDYIENIDGEYDIIIEDQNRSFKDKLYQNIFYTILVFIVISMLTGVVVIFQGIYQILF